MKKNIVLCLVLMIIWSCSSSNGPEDSGDGTIDNPSAAPEFNLKTETGAEISLSDFRGKIVYLFFIGYNCPPCIASAPVTEQIHQRFKGDKVAVIAIDVWDGGLAEVASFRNKTGVTYPICLNGSGTGSSYGVSNDFSVVIDGSGELIYKSAGVNQENIEMIIENLVD